MPEAQPENPYDEDKEPDLHTAWTEGAEAAHADEDIGPIEDLYDDPGVAYAFLKGYMETSQA